MFAQTIAFTIYTLNRCNVWSTTESWFTFFRAFISGKDREYRVSPLVVRAYNKCSTTVLAYFSSPLGSNGTNLITLCHWAYRSQEAGVDHYWRTFYIHLSFCNERRILILRSVWNRSYACANYSCSPTFTKLCTMSCLYLIFGDEMYKNLWPHIYVLLYKLGELLVKWIKITVIQ